MSLAGPLLEMRLLLSATLCVVVYVYPASWVLSALLRSFLGRGRACQMARPAASAGMWSWV